MPAYHSPSPSLSSFSSTSSQRLASMGSPNVSILDYVKLLDNNNSFDALKVALFERQDLVIKTNKMKHLASSIDRTTPGRSKSTTRIYGRNFQWYGSSRTPPNPQKTLCTRKQNPQNEKKSQI